jgi:hypothetical protein
VVQLHHIVQVVMGWNNWHLHYFQIFGRQYGIDYTGGDQFLGIPQITRLGDFGLRTNDTFHYMYDYYNRWAHQLRIEAIIPDEGRYQHPSCLEGKRACPPEETGGPTVYTHRIEEQRFWAYDWLDTLVERLLSGKTRPPQLALSGKTRPPHCCTEILYCNARSIQAIDLVRVSVWGEASRL